VALPPALQPSSGGTQDGLGALPRCHISLSYYQQKAELPELKAACPAYAEVNAQVLQEVIVRVERTYQAFFRRIPHGEQPGYPRFQGRDRSHSFTSPP
jgi:putative transposase